MRSAPPSPLPWLAAAIATCALGGCSLVFDTERHQVNSNAEPVPANEFCAVVAREFCAAQTRCCMVDAGLPPQSECEGAVERDCIDSVGDIALDSRTGYDAAIAGRELAEARALAEDCDPDLAIWLASKDGLQSVLTGTLEEGEECTGDSLDDRAALFSCKDDLVCSIQASGGWECILPSGLRGTCRIDSDCEAGFYCDTGLILLIEGECAQLRADGEGCSRPAQCASRVCDEGTCRPATVDEVYCGDPLTGG